MLRYPCLVLDHDDTVVNSTATIHYPAFLDAMNKLRSGSDVTLEDYFRLNFDPGFMEYMRDACGFTDEDFDAEYKIWQSWVSRIIPEAYPGMVHLVRRQIAEGGRVCVISHSVDTNIRRDWKANGLPEPELVFGWEQPPERRKPNPWPLREIMRRLDLPADRLLMVDDLKPGLDMARAAGVDFAAALWSHSIPEIRAHMHAVCDQCFETPEALEHWLFD
ncbi:MAG: HAD family hydrolase [Clostridia bacterium]|nr:HAD family hydrolase [Clostridia bacterium]